MINIYGTGVWATKITSLLNVGEYSQYNDSDYDQAGPGDWVIALENGEDRVAIEDGNLQGSTFYQLFKGCNNLNGSTIGDGATIGCCTLIRPGTTIGKQFYIGANCTVDLNCVIGDGVTVGDNVVIKESTTIPDNTTIPSGSICFMLGGELRINLELGS